MAIELDTEGIRPTGVDFIVRPDPTVAQFEWVVSDIIQQWCIQRYPIEDTPLERIERQAMKHMADKLQVQFTMIRRVQDEEPA